MREDASIGQAVGSVSGAGPAGRVAFTLDSLTPISEFPAFDVDRSSGQLVVAHSLDRENVSEYHLEIRALDTTSIGNPQSIAVSVKIAIEDANDNPPRWPQDPITVRVSERAAIGSTIYNLTAIDLDSGLNGDLRYGLVAEFPSRDSFAVDSLTGALTLAKPLDREERAEYTLILRASDRAPPGERLASTVTARIIVLDQNDNDPVFVAPESTKVAVTPDLLPGERSSVASMIVPLIARSLLPSENCRCDVGESGRGRQGRGRQRAGVVRDHVGERGGEVLGGLRIRDSELGEAYGENDGARDHGQRSRFPAAQVHPQADPRVGFWTEQRTPPASARQPRGQDFGGSAGRSAGSQRGRPYHRRSR